ncbi:MAG: LPXTG cell wall anchor domain-containing protein [Acidimicrobiales bacterium]|nr:LPXTG cell wall anchor domain-containing protein [Acidimicrobiales bacterium]
MVVSPARSAVDVGDGDPCQMPTLNAVNVGVVDPCDPCQVLQAVPVAIVDPCEPPVASSTSRPWNPGTQATTTSEAPTTTAEVTTTTAEATTTTGVVTTVTEPPTTTSTPVAVGGADDDRPSTGGQALARTGSSTTPMTVAGIALAGLGAVLLLAERRRITART